MKHLSRILIAAVLTAIALFASAAPVPKDRRDESYWPITVGTRWVYEQNGQESTEEITKVEPLKAGVRLTIRVRDWDDMVDVAPDGVTKRTTGKFTLDQLALRFPIKSGDSWAVSTPIQMGLVCEAGKMTVGDEEDIKVPAGTFRATKVVNTVAEVGGKPIELPYTYAFWYAKGVGMVRIEWNGGFRALKSFTPGKRQ